MYFFLKSVTAALILAIISVIRAAPASSSGVSITVKNSCSKKFKILKLENNAGSAIESQALSAGESRKYHVPPGWAGRFWGCEEDETGCDQYGGPASLAEFRFNGAYGIDYYDISFVDGFNHPIRIEPVAKNGSGYDCGAPACASLPSCPKDLKTRSGACNSACNAFKSDAYCCTGSFTEGKCKPNWYADHFKSACPDAYSYAYDDALSTFGCSSKRYTITFCP